MAIRAPNIFVRFWEWVEDQIPHFKHHVLHNTGEQALSLVNNGPVLIGSAGGLIARANGFGAVIGIGAVAGLSASIMQMHYRHEIDKLKELYEDDLERIFGKPIKNITDKDLKKLGNANPIIGEALSQAKKERNIGIVVLSAASLVAFGAIAWATAPLGLLAGLHGVTGFLAEMATSAFVYNAVRIPLKWVGEKIFGVTHDCTHDRIADIAKKHGRGKEIMREQVLSVLVSLNPSIDQAIVNSSGKSFDDLDATDQKRAASSVGAAIPLDRLTRGINDGSIQITQLVMAPERVMAAVSQAPTAAADDSKPTISFVERLAQQREQQAMLQQRLN